MAYTFIEARIMPKQSVASTASTAAVAVTTIARAKDPVYGEGEFIYLRTTASCTVGSLVTWYTRTLGSVVTSLTPNTVSNGVPIAVSMVAGVATTYAWFQISGTAPVKKMASICGINVRVYQGATTGRVRALTSVGKTFLGMRSAQSTSATASSVLCTFNRPHQTAA